MAHIYSIDFDHIRTELKEGTELPTIIHHFGRFDLYSDQEIPMNRLLEIMDEVKRALPEGLTVDEFEESAYHVLEEKGLRRFQRVIDHGSIGKIEYKQRKKPPSQQ